MPLTKQSQDGQNDMAKPSAPKRGGLIVGIIMVAIVLSWLAGLIFFAGNLATSPTVPAAADGIIALTGGDTRLTEAMNLLNAQKGKKLLISGVNPAAGREDIRGLLGSPDALFACCVDLDRAAANTIGNAVQSAKWVRDNDYHQIILVTSNYHMPRSMLEFRRAMPDVEIIPYPIQSDHINIDQWWKKAGTTRFLASEYNKYLASLIRIRFF